VEQPGSSSGS